MNKHIFGTVGLSLLLLLGSAPTALLAHEGHEYGDRQSEYGEREDARRYDPRYDDNRWEDEEEDEDIDRPSSRRYPLPDWQRSAPREQRGRPR